MEETQEYFKNTTMESSEVNMENGFYETIVYNEKGEFLQPYKTLELIEQMYNESNIDKDILYMYLLSCSDTFLVNELVKSEKSNFKLFGYPGSFYDLAIYQKRQWFELSIENDDMNILFDEDLIKIGNILKLVQYTNKPTNATKDDFIKDYGELNDFWNLYFSRIKYLWEVIECCVSVESNIDLKEIFIYSSQHACLEILFNHLQPENFKYEGIINILKQEDQLYNSTKQVDNILAYSIIMTIFKCIQEIYLLTNIKDVIQHLKEKVLSINDKKLIIEVFENVFTILFSMSDSFKKNYEGRTFICQEPEIRLILILLKELLDETKLKGLYKSQSNGDTDFSNIEKYVLNALWRLDLISKVKNSHKCGRKLLKYMLAMPESLIQMCLKEGDYERAYQVVQIFSLKNDLSMEIDYCQKLSRLKQILKRAFKLNSSAETNADLSIEQIVKQFFAKNPIISNLSNENVIKNSEFNVLKQFLDENALFSNMLDLAITQPTDFTGSERMLHLAFEFNKLDSSVSSAYYDFARKLCDLMTTKAYAKKSLRNMITLGNFSLDINRYVRENEIYVDLLKLYNAFQKSMSLDETGALNNNHPNHMTAVKISKTCSMAFRDGEVNTKYLYKLLNYLKVFSKILYIEKNNSNIISNGKHSSVFSILSHNRSELMGELLFVRNLDPDEFEKYFVKLKLDYLYHVIGNCFPTINLHTEEILAQEEMYPENYLYTPKKAILTYIQKRNWLLAFILNEIYQVEGVDVGITEIRVKTFINYSNLSAIKNLTEMYSTRKVIAAIQNEINFAKLKEYIYSELDKFEYAIEQSKNGAVVTAYSEDILRRKNITQLLDIVDSVSEIQIRKNRDFIELKDAIISSYVNNGEQISLVQMISNRNLRTGIVLKHLKYWPGTLCVELIKSEITKFEEVENAELFELMSWLTRISFYEELKEILGVSHWSDALNICESNKEIIMSKLLNHYNIKVLENFITLHSPNEKNLLAVSDSYLLEIFDRLEKFESIGKLLDNLPFEHAIAICFKLLGKLRNISQLEYVVSYLASNVNNDENLKKIQISLKIVKDFTTSEQDQLLGLISDPMSILEVLVMNMKFDRLCLAVNVLRSEILHYEFSDESISNEKIDLLLRNYADKSLDFRIITHPNPRLLKTPEYQVPTRENWVLNSEVVDCMCCKKTTFSMFNRRHHCRRCGRVVCYYCSNKRMLVPTYGDIMVRVCKDCHQQSMEDPNKADLNDNSMSTKSAVNDFWLLTNDPTHNEIIRAEFAYEDAPSISLCLSIMKFHRKTAEYPRLLLDQCNVLLQLLQPNRECVEEIDYYLVIKMLKHLATAAKMAAIECTEHFGISSADRILSQADLLNLFVERGCLNLLSVATGNFYQSTYIDASILRRLCDKLLEREQWNLALEVSTKAGLDRTGVFSAWGKSCLRAGNLLLARDKFQRCLEKTNFTGSTSDVSLASDYSSRKSISWSKFSVQTGFKVKKTQNSTLLNEIVNILEKNMRVLRPNSSEASSKQLANSTFTLNDPDTDNAVYISNKMKNFKDVAQGNYKSEDTTQVQNFSTKPSPNIFYDECIFYLGKYGTPMNLLDFFVKYGNVYEALKYIIDNQLNTEAFVHVYLKCLKHGLIGILQGYILTIDASFETWKDYLRHLCRHLVIQNMYNSLYQLQHFMGDHVRAAMTCIKFYQDNINHFSDLISNEKYLLKAKKHLTDLVEQDQWVDVSPVHKLSSSLESFEEKSLNNSSLIMKMSPEEVNKHIETIGRQDEIVKFLSEREKLDPQSIKIVLDTFQTERQEDPAFHNQTLSKIPTLFGTTDEKNKLVVLTILSGEKIEDGFKIGQTLIEEFNLTPITIYCEAGKILAKYEKYNGISQLVSCIKQLKLNSEVLNNMCDEMLTLAVAMLSKANCSETKVEDLIKLITDRPTKVSAYIEAKQLKTAYFLAVKYKRTSDIRRIMKQADVLNQPSIKILCQKVLQSQPHQIKSKK